MKVNPDTFETCAAKIAAKGRMSNAQALDLINQLATRAEQMRTTGVKDPFVTAADELATDLKSRAADEHANALKSRMIREGVYSDIEKAGGISKAFGTLEGLLFGRNDGSRDSIQARWRGSLRDWLSDTEFKLRQSGLMELARKGIADLKIAREWWALNEGKPPINPNSPEAQIAKIMHTAADRVRNRLNGAGARIGDALDFVQSADHDPRLMRAAAGAGKTPAEAFEAWRADVEPRLAQKTYDLVEQKAGETPQEARVRFLRSVYNALVSGVHMTKNIEATGFDGPANIARRVSEGRVLFWKDADAWHEYTSKYGQAPTLLTGLYRSFESGSKNLALMEKLGVNARATFNQMLKRIPELYRDVDLDGTDKFKEKIASLNRAMDYLDGTANLPANKMWARIGATLRMISSMDSLGGVGLTHLVSTLPTVPSELRHHGINRLYGLAMLMGKMLQGRGNLERQRMLAQLGAYGTALARDAFSQWEHADDVPGKLSSIANKFFNATLIHHVYDTAQAATQEMLAENLAHHANVGFEALDPHLKQMLGKYGFDSTSWDLLRKHGELTDANGYKYMTPHAAHTLDAGAVEAHLKKTGVLEADASAETIKREVRRFRNEMTDKMNAYYSDAAAHAVVTPGVRERAFVSRLGEPGTATGEAARFIAQFKMWPAAAMTQLLGREIHMSTSVWDATHGIAYIMGMSTVSGYLRMLVNDYANGRPPRDPTDGRTLLAAMAQGGGLGIWGDYLFGESNRMGGGEAATAMGPVLGDAFGILSGAKKFMTDILSKDPDVQSKALEHMWPDLAHGLVKHVPFANLIYVKGILDYMLWYHLYEAASPGWWERTNQRLLKEQGRAMTGYQPGGEIPWTPFAIGHRETAQPEEEQPSEPSGGSEAAPSEGGGSSSSVTQPTF